MVVSPVSTTLEGDERLDYVAPFIGKGTPVRAGTLGNLVKQTDLDESGHCYNSDGTT